MQTLKFFGEIKFAGMAGGGGTILVIITTILILVCGVITKRRRASKKSGECCLQSLLWSLCIDVSVEESRICLRIH